jgi:hypothetical protein
MRGWSGDPFGRQELCWRGVAPLDGFLESSATLRSVVYGLALNHPRFLCQVVILNDAVKPRRFTRNEQVVQPARDI